MKYLSIIPTTRYKTLFIILIAVLALTTLQYNLVHVAAACAAQSTARGAATSSFSIPTSGTYRIWSRMLNPSTANNSYILEIDDTTCGVIVGDNSAVQANVWTWVDYQSGTTTNKINVTLAAGTHTIKLIGREDNVEIDKIIMTTDTSCVPTGTGDNCIGSADTVLPTAPTGLSAAAASPSKVNLAWSAATDNVGVTGYVIYRNSAQLTSVGAVTTYSDTSVTSTNTYTYSVKAVDAAGNQGPASNIASATTPAPVDTTPPSVPSNLTASAANSNLVNLSWTASSDNVAVTGYKIYRNSTLVGTVMTGLNYADNTVSGNTSYTYVIKAVDAAGNISADSNSSTVTTPVAPDTTAPSVPTGVTSKNTTASSTTLSWTASTDNTAVTGYTIYRNGTKVGAVSGTTLIFTDSGITASTAYSYTVSAQDAAANSSAQSTPLVVTTLASADTTNPTATTNVKAVADSATQVTVSWTAATDNVGVTGYYILRNGAVIAQATKTSFVDTGLSPATSYSYTVEAYDAAKNIGPLSTPSTVTTPKLSDTVAPSAPSNVAASIASQTQINLSWAASTDNVGVAGYRVTRNGSLLGTSPNTSFGDATAQIGATYTYSVIAYDAAGNASSASSTTATSPSSWYATKHGLSGYYFNNTKLTGTSVSRTDGAVDFSWGSTAPISGVAADNYSVRWQGRVEAPTTGAYTFYTTSDDGVRLWVNNVLLVDNWTNHSAVENSGTINLNGGQKYSIKMEYYEAAGLSTAKLAWSGPSISKTVIPSANLYTNSYGLFANYFNNTSLTSPSTFARTDNTVNFDWASGSPDAQLPVDNYSVRWSGYVYPPSTGVTTFYTDSDDGVRVWVNGQQIINNWANHSVTTNSGTATLNVGVAYPITIEYYENAGLSTSKLYWSAANLSKQIVPSGNLRDR